ncbi:diguanylate cyclase (GGDEF)-like protein [Streptomyces sp. 1114.5]|uniref:GGDEF domain-containing protein n=1 Tax=Streptomyces sp. 1114.5 TaxID=1938830 RepID=UPI000F161E33|nr:GGDEF domain-containing protein [Streptomyces sp. 1114.5]RKT16252.1 diguanylate cyclase (GGDEF)-like protein [Streptomyces sp. 1114.5]
MSTPLLVQALAALSAPAVAGATVLGLRGRRARASAAAGAERLKARIAELEERCAELERTASCDPLTGVWNYRHLQLTLDREIERARRAEQTDQADGPRPLAVLMLAIAGFDAVVAEHGRGRAGAVLRDLAQRLAMEIRRADTLGRYSGEEFLVVLPDTGAEGAAQVAERLVWSVRRHLLLDWSSGTRAPRPAHGNGLTAAVGIAVLPEDGTHAAVLLRAADAALAEARAAGGDCWRSTAGAPERAAAGRPAPVASGAGQGPTAERNRSEKPGSLSACAGGDPLAQPVTSHTPASVAVPRDVLS